MPIIHVEGFWNLLSMSLVYGERKADNEHSNPLFYCPSPLNSQHLHFQFKVATLLKIFVRSRRNWEKKCREGSRQAAIFAGCFYWLLPSFQNLQVIYDIIHLCWNTLFTLQEGQSSIETDAIASLSLKAFYNVFLSCLNVCHLCILLPLLADNSVMYIFGLEREAINYNTFVKFLIWKLCCRGYFLLPYNE